MLVECSHVSFRFFLTVLILLTSLQEEESQTAASKEEQKVKIDYAEIQRKIQVGAFVLHIHLYINADSKRGLISLPYH